MRGGVVRGGVRCGGWEECVEGEGEGLCVVWYGGKVLVERRDWGMKSCLVCGKKNGAKQFYYSTSLYYL